MDVSQNFKIVGRTLRDSEESQAGAVMQADSLSAQSPMTPLQPLPVLVKRRQKWRLHATSSAVPALHDLPLPPLQVSQRYLQSPSNQQSSPSPHNQPNPTLNEHQKLSLSTRSEKNPAPPIPPPQSNLVRSPAGIVDSGDLVIASRENFPNIFHVNYPNK